MGSTRAGGGGTDGGLGQLHLISWNVAGWKRTTEQIRRFRGLSEFLRRHQVDVLCIQETKLTAKQVKEEGRNFGAESPGYETFWACNDGNGGQRQGLNGVATFARKGLVLRADASPLGEPDLDGEGRCLLTDFGSFVIFNVYVPNSSGGPRLPYKLQWLAALRAAMQRERSKGKAVILAGDLNLKNRLVDAHWSFRPVRAVELRESAQLEAASSLDEESRRLLEAAGESWDQLEASLRQKEHRAIETRNSKSGQVFQRWGVFARPVARPLASTRVTSGLSGSGSNSDLDQDAAVRIGPPMESEDSARSAFMIDGWAVESDGQIVVGTAAISAAFPVTAPGVLSLGELLECLRRLAGLELTPTLTNWLATHVAGPCSPPAVRDWLSSLFQEDTMVDSFAELFPQAEERFTCWDQYRNKRHENVGSRIDYILVDRAFFSRHASAGAGPDGRGNPSPLSAGAALSAAKMEGLAQPSPFGGGGMPALEEDEYQAQFRADVVGPLSGMVYTPQQLSDHIGVSLLLIGTSQGELELSKDPATQRCQPHRSSRRITDFFGKRKASDDLPAEKPKVTHIG